MTEVGCATKQDIDRVVSQAKQAQIKWNGFSWTERSAILREVGRLIRVNIELLSDWEVRDNGKPIHEAKTDILTCAESFEYFSGLLYSCLF